MTNLKLLGINNILLKLQLYIICNMYKITVKKKIFSQKILYLCIYLFI